MNDTLRLCVVGPLPPPEGGMANQTRQLIEKLRGIGTQVDVVRTNAPYCPEFIGKVQGVRAIARLLPYLIRLVLTIRRCDVVHVMANSGLAWHLFAAPAVWVAAALRKPVIINYRGGEAGPFMAKAARRVRFTMRRAHAVVVPSGFLKGVFGAHGIACKVIPNIVDLVRFRPAEPTSSASRPRQIVVTRNLEPIYGIETAIKATAQLHRSGGPAVRLAVAGVGPSRESLERLAEAEGVSSCVEFLGRMDRDRVAQLYQASDIALNPSLVDNMPNSVLEAMACGVPVVSTDVGGVPFIVENERTALLVAPGDVDSMCRALRRLLVDGELASRLRRASLDEVQRYGWDAVAPQWLEAYRLAARRPS